MVSLLLLRSIVFQFSGKVKVFILFLAFLLTLLSGLPRRQSTLISRFSLFFFTIIRSGCLAKMRWSVCTAKSYWSLCVSLSWTDAGLCLWFNISFLYNSKWIIFVPQLRLVLYSCANLMYSLIMWLVVSSLSPMNLHLLFVTTCLFLP